MKDLTSLERRNLTAVEVPPELEIRYFSLTVPGKPPEKLIEEPFN